MKTILVKNYQCEYCDKIFDSLWECDLHEREKHKCPYCKNSYYVYGCELNCTKINDHKKCKFERRKIS